MAKQFKPVVFAANDLIEGDSVYLGAEGWTRDIRGAAVAETREARDVLAARAEGDAAIIVGPYDVEVSLEPAGPWPLKRREQIKASGSTTIAVGPQAQVARAA
ncbi:MAG: DUF2849 domain-containing protein [Pseudomonadota bacterium]